MAIVTSKTRTLGSFLRANLRHRFSAQLASSSCWFKPCLTCPSARAQSKSCTLERGASFGPPIRRHIFAAFGPGEKKTLRNEIVFQQNKLADASLAAFAHQNYPLARRTCGATTLHPPAAVSRQPLLQRNCPRPPRRPLRQWPSYRDRTELDARSTHAAESNAVHIAAIGQTAVGIDVRSEGEAMALSIASVLSISRNSIYIAYECVPSIVPFDYDSFVSRVF